MKISQNMNKFNYSRRSLRLEALENREMLSATPFDSAAVANETVEIVATAEFSGAVVDLGDVDASTGDLTFVATDAASQFTMSWDAIEDAQSYVIKLSRDGGETWVTYYKTSSAENPTAPSCTVKGLYVNNVYSFRVYGVNESGKIFGDPLEGTFAPLKIAASSNSYQAGDTINITLSGADEASASINWYNVTDEGDVEITEAAGLLSYTATSDDYPIKVVATGTGYSTGSNSQTTIVTSGTLSASYNAESHQVTLDWNDVDDAVVYRVLVSRDSGETWTTYAKTTESNVTVNGIYVGKSYSYQVYAYNSAETLNATTLVGYDSGTFAPVDLAVNVTEYEAGDAINATLKGASDASADIAWFYVTDEGDVEIAEAAGLYSYTPATAENDIKIVLTGTNYSEGSGAEAIVSVHVNLLGDGEFGDYVTVSRNVELTWNVVEDATSYRFLKASTDSSTGWKKAATITVEDGVVTSGNAVISDDGTELTYTIGMFNVGDVGDFRVVAVDEHGYTLETQDFSFTNFGLQLDHDAYDTAGDTLIAATIPTTSVAFQWYSSSDAGATWTEISGATSESYAISADEGAAQLAYKVVATSETGETSVAYAAPDVLTAPVDLEVSVDGDNVLNMTFVASDNADEYQVEYYYANAAYPVWLNMTQVTYVDNGDGTITATHVNGANYVNYDIRVRAVGNGTLSDWAEATGPERPSLVVTTANDVLDQYDYQISLREAILYRQYLLSHGMVAPTDPITFDATVFDGSEDAVITLAADTGDTYSCNYYDNAATGGGFTVDSSLYVDASALGGVNVMIDGVNVGTRVFTVAGSGVELSLDSLAVRNATSGVIAAGTNTTVTVTNSTFTNNAASNGSAISSTNGTVNIVGSTFDSNTGRTIYASGGTVNVSGDSVFSNNASDVSGAAIAISSGNLVIDGASFSNNVVTENGVMGGAILLATPSTNASAFTASINNATFTENAVKPHTASKGVAGGAIAVQHYQSLTISNSTFTGNQSAGGSQGGGAIRCNGTSLVISDSTFTGNHAKQTGGAIYFLNDVEGLAAEFTIENTVFDGNYASNGSVIAFNSIGYKTTASVATTIVNSSFLNTSNNSSVTSYALYLDKNSVSSGAGSSVRVENTLFAGIPGSIYSKATTIPLTIVNSTIVNNSVTAISNFGTTDIYNSILWGNRKDFLTEGGHVTVGNTLTDVNFAAYSGSPWVAVSGSTSPLNADYTINESAATVTLTNGSTVSVIDSGDDSKVQQSVDRAGNARIVGAAVDLGAYEVQTSSEALVDEAFADFFDEFFE
ncbi:MAG: fibronectin type III domain-containing protein [Thermoguttaceae bacterium]|nr:fibronectin type III domain-containing protein [Thermoguttaceae bacterium]